MLIQATDEQVKRMGVLAVMASRPMGMGFLHYKPDLSAADVEAQLEVTTGFKPGLFIDYFQGRMVKFRAWKKADGWEFPDSISHEYESWDLHVPELPRPLSCG